MRYLNTMETLVERIYEELRPSLDCCDCEQCRTNIMCYALNRIQPRYADTIEGAKIVEVMMSRPQELADIRSIIVKGAIIVHDHPRH